MWWPAAKATGSSTPRLGLDCGDRFQGDVTAPQGGLQRTDGEVRLYCRSEERAHKERGIVERFSRRFEQGLVRLSEGLSRPRAHKGIEKVRERIGRLKEQSRGVAQHYTIEVLTDESGRKATALSWKRQPRQGSMAPIRASTACAATRPTGTRRACGAPTPLSPTWKRCFAP